MLSIKKNKHFLKALDKIKGLIYALAALIYTLSELIKAIKV
jgi:hypothetical protein